MQLASFVTKPAIALRQMTGDPSVAEQVSCSVELKIEQKTSLELGSQCCEPRTVTKSFRGRSKSSRQKTLHKMFGCNSPSEFVSLKINRVCEIEMKTFEKLFALLKSFSIQNFHQNLKSFKSI